MEYKMLMISLLIIVGSTLILLTLIQLNIWQNLNCLIGVASIFFFFLLGFDLKQTQGSEHRSCSSICFKISYCEGLF
jgi:hypothetical protein